MALTLFPLFVHLDRGFEPLFDEVDRLFRRFASLFRFFLEAMQDIDGEEAVESS